MKRRAARPTRQIPALLRVVTHLPLMTALACSTGVPQGPFSTFCPSDTTPGSGNLDKPSSVTVAVKTHGDGRQSAYAVALNPDLRQARAVDITGGLMVPAPNVYFPMAVKLGSFSEDVASSSDGEVAIALDAQDLSLRFFNLGDSEEGEAWKRRGDDVTSLDPRPTGLAVRGPLTDLTVVVSHAGDPVGSLTVIRWNSGQVTTRVRINVGGRPSGVGLTDDGRLAVVSNAEGNTLFVVDLTADNSSTTLPLPSCATSGRPCALDVGGPTNELSVGSAPGRPGADAPRYPVVLALRRDIPAVAVARLTYFPSPDLPNDAWVDRMRSDTDALQATVMLPRFPAAVALAPNPAPQCCEGVPFAVDPTALANGGFAYALVAMVNGSIAYLDLDAQDGSGRRMPRIIDKNSTPPGPLLDTNCNVVDYNTSTDNYRTPAMFVDGGPPPDLSTRPKVEFTVTSDSSGTPLVVQQNLDDDYVFVWEGILPSVSFRTLRATGAQLAASIVQDERTTADLVSLGVRPEDALEIPVQDGCPCPAGNPDCTVVASLEVSAVAGSTMRINGLQSIRDCLANDRVLRYGVRGKSTFSVTGGLSGRGFGRVAFMEWLDVPGMRLRMVPADYQGGDPGNVLSRDGGFVDPGVVTPATDNPPPRDAVLVVPMRSNFDPFILGTDDVAPTQGRFFPAGSIPTGLATAVVPVNVVTSSGTQAFFKAVGILSAAGGGLLIQFDLALHPPCPAPGAATCASQVVCSSNLSRSNVDSQFKFFE
jgi:hypothetical protein